MTTEGDQVSTSTPLRSPSPLKLTLLETLGMQDAFDQWQPIANPSQSTWNSDVQIFGELIARTRPQIVIEVGSWMGLSAIRIVEELRKAGLTDSVVICIDTWIGDWHYWAKPEWKSELRLEHNFPQFYRDFLTNITQANVQDQIIAMPMTSYSAYQYLSQKKILADLIYIDGGHDTLMVYQDLMGYWDLRKPEGILFGDDWKWLTVEAAVRRFTEEKNLGDLLNVKGNHYAYFK